METAPSSSLSPGQVRSKHERTLNLGVNKLKRKRKEENSPQSVPDREMKSSMACFPDTVVVGVPRIPPKNQKFFAKTVNDDASQNSRGAQMKERPEFRYVKPKDSGKKHQHTSSSSVVDTTPSPERTVSENTRIHKPRACTLGVVNQKPRTESSHDAGVSENYYKPGPRLNTSDAALRYAKKMWDKYDTSFRAQMGKYHTLFRELMGAVFSRVPEERITRNHVKNAKTLDKYFEKYFSFPEGGSEAAQLVMKRGTRSLKCNQKGGRHLRDRRPAAKKLWARVIVKILKKAKEMMRRKKHREMPPSGDSQTGTYENGKVETNLQGGVVVTDSESSLGGSPSAPDDPLESDIEDGPIEEKQ